MYMRRDTGNSARIRTTLDNKWVIPYNPYLSSLIDCYLKAEVCFTIQAVKYLKKYVYKAFNFRQTGEAQIVDEIKQCQSGRYISPCEAKRRIFGFDLFEIHPLLILLPVHLPNMQTIQGRPHECLDVVISDDKRYCTALTEFF